jgi:hypothetical protein
MSDGQDLHCRSLHVTGNCILWPSLSPPRRPDPTSVLENNRLARNPERRRAPNADTHG